MKSKGCSSEPASASTWNCGRRLLRTTFTWCSDFCASRAEIFTWRLLSSARDSAASRLSSGSSGKGGVAGPCASSVAGAAADSSRHRRKWLGLLRQRSDAVVIVVVCPALCGAVGKVTRFMLRLRARRVPAGASRKSRQISDRRTAIRPARLATVVANPRRPGTARSRTAAARAQDVHENSPGSRGPRNIELATSPARAAGELTAPRR